MNIREKINASRARLVAAGIENGEAGRDANLLARHLLGWDRATVYTRETEDANAAFIERFDALTERRARREPVAYIRGEQEFWSRDFAVNSAVLIPRPETELVIEELLECFPADLPHRPCHILGWDRATVYTRETKDADAAFVERFDALTERRARREPVAYIRGEQEFWSRDFAVGPSVLIPRPETELIIEELLESFPASKVGKLLKQRSRL